jgi:hypothetical protein
MITNSTVNLISNDALISTVISTLPSNTPIKIELDGKTGILLDELQYDGLMETIRILQENPTIVLSLLERENDEFIDENEFMEYI